MKDLLRSVATEAGLSAEILLRKDRRANVVEVRDRFIREAVLEQAILLLRWGSF
jgi:hypothetical protein